MLSIDLNCDMAEGMLTDVLIMPYISSVNIACGYHAGDVDTMKKTIDLALQYNVAIGAHPGFNDKENFGRKEQLLSYNAYYQLVTEQLYIIQKFITAAAAGMHHVKPHGALYNMSANDAELAATIASAVKDFDPRLILYGLSNSHSIKEAEKQGLKTASEVFADRTYNDNGSLTPRSHANAVIEDADKCIQQVIQMVTQQSVISLNKEIVPVKTGTICIHGDGEHAVLFAKKINAELRSCNILIKAF